MSIAAFFLSSFLAYAAPSAQDPAWLALLHSPISGRSSISAGEFFLSPEGHKDPAAELVATLAYFASEPSAPCRFPARAIYLGWKKIGKGELCERWNKWKEAISPKGLELVFATAYLNSPSSMYGHTLLKFPRSGKTEGEELLDYTFNYGADPGRASGPAYVLKGLLGGFSGFYSTAPFYMKVKEYNFVENRDFWIYPLRITPAETELLLAHAWEIRSAALPYYFLKRNCSYYLLEFLEVARPGQELTKSFPLWAVPIDTIRRLQAKGWLGEGRVRPSRAKITAAEFAELSGEERSQVTRLVSGEKNIALPRGREAKVLDAAYDLWRYRNEAKHGAKSEVEEHLLRERARFREPLPQFVFSDPPPETGHLSGRLGLLAGRNRTFSFGEIQYRGTFHDLLAPPEGYEPYNELSMGDLRARFEKRRIYLDRADILRIRALSPRSQWFPRFAWSLRLAYDRAREMNCSDWRCATGVLQGGPGISTKVGPFLVFALAELDAELGGIFDPNYRVAAGPTGGIHTPLWSQARLLIEGEYRWKLLGEKRQRRPLRVGLAQSISTNWELRAQGETNRNYREGSFGLFHYF